MNAAKIIATWFGAGLLPKAPGTWGSLAAIPFGLMIYKFLGPAGLALATIAITFLGAWAAAEFDKHEQTHDNSRIVVDEVAGQWISLLPAGLDPFLIVLSFLLFRAFDITKPWPCRNLEKLPGGWGVMADDIAAGFYALIIITGLRYAGLA